MARDVSIVVSHPHWARVSYHPQRQNLDARGILSQTLVMLVVAALVNMSLPRFPSMWLFYQTTERCIILWPVCDNNGLTSCIHTWNIPMLNHIGRYWLIPVIIYQNFDHPPAMVRQYLKVWYFVEHLRQQQ